MQAQKLEPTKWRHLAKCEGNQKEAEQEVEREQGEGDQACAPEITVRHFLNTQSSHEPADFPFHSHIVVGFVSPVLATQRISVLD